MKVVTLTKKNKILKGEINLPASKSISNRALIINHLTQNQLQLHNLSMSDDTQLMISLLDIVKKSQSSEFPVELNCENAGTVLRFLSALLANTPGNWILTGTERMKERPINILVEALLQLGADINYLDKNGFPPLEIKGKSLSGGKIKIDGSVSSQFISALLLIAPVLEKGLQLTLTNIISSRSYIEMTLGLLKHFGINYTFEGNKIYIKHQNFVANDLLIEPDWSAAAYWYEMGAFADEADILLKDLNLSTLTLKSGLTERTGLMEKGLVESHKSLQGDSILPELYQVFGVNSEFLDQGIRLTKKGNPVTQFEFDFTDHPDLAQSVIVTCAVLGIKGKFTGLESLKIKETDRLKALQTEFQKLRFKTETVRGSPEGIPTEKFNVQSYIPDTINPDRYRDQSKIINTYQDHRMAMAFAPLAIIFNSLQIENPRVVSKSYPEFWNDLNKVKIDTYFSI